MQLSAPLKSLENFQIYQISSNHHLVHSFANDPNIIKISKFNKTLKEIDVSLGETQMKAIEFTCKNKTSLVDGKLYWNGNLLGQEFKCIGENCLPIKPSIDLNPPE